MTKTKRKTDMSSVVVFNPTAFTTRYPEFSTVDSGLLYEYFTEATLYLNNTINSVVQDVATRALMLNMVTAHIAAMNGQGANGQGSSPLVGRIDSATEGSVTVHAQYTNAQSGSAAWFNQTKYGAAYWAASKPYRSFRYVAPQRRVC